MTEIQKYSSYFEAKKEKDVKKKAPPPDPSKKPFGFNFDWDKPFSNMFGYGKPGKRVVEKDDQIELPLFPDENPISDEKDKEEGGEETSRNPYLDFLKKKEKKEKKKISKKDLEEHPYFKFLPKDVMDTLMGKEGEELDEDDVAFDIDSLPIQVGDYVICEDFNDLNDSQIEFLKSKPFHKVRTVCDSKGRYYKSGEPHIEIGYRIPYKMFRFKAVERDVAFKHKFLFLQFDLAIDTHGEKDKHNYFKGKRQMSELFPLLFKDKLKDSLVDFCNYDDIYRVNNDYYIDNMRLKEYDFVFFGFMSNFSTVVKMLIHYLDKHNIPYLKYGTYKDLDNKAYEFHLLESLGYPYIPSIMATKLTKRVIQHVKEFGFPVIVKDVNLNRGEGVFKIDKMSQLVDHFGYNNKLMLIQKFIPNDGDYRVISIKNKVELVIKKERIKGSKEFRANVARGGKAVKGSLPPDIIAMCEDISKHLICDIVGFDIIQDKVTGKYYVMEANSSPHFPTFSVISEINIPEIITDYIIKHRRK
jgi:glutathione synthase/RimK-type ligase-like ATP-grasp enzyme